MSDSGVTSLGEVPSVMAYLRRIGAEPVNFRQAAIYEEATSGYRRHKKTIKFAADGKVTAPKGLEPTEAEQQEITYAFAEANFPKLMPIMNIGNPPSEWGHSPDLFEFRDEHQRIVMVQQRVETEEGKAYIPWTWWSDSQWRKMEPEGLLPLYGLNTVAGNATVFIHEGAKAARAMQEMIAARTSDQSAKLAAHPWGEQMQHAAHLGWIGGAPNPHRTDWSVLRRLGVERAYIICDNDDIGRAAVPVISESIGMECDQIQWSQRWPAGFDMADDFPRTMFQGEHYTGPAFRETLLPATWATDLEPTVTASGKPGKSRAVLRPAFAATWAYVRDVQRFVSVSRASMVYDRDQFRDYMARYSHKCDLPSLALKGVTRHIDKLTYRPDLPARFVDEGDQSALNTYVPPNIRPLPGSPAPFLEFMAYLIPNEAERYQVLRWLATLIACPGRRLLYGLLLISEMQGLGKTTLGEAILTPLLGRHNVRMPNEMQITDSTFTGWTANTRLIWVNEIYDGQSKKAYNRLKTVITDETVSVNEKYTKEHTLPNFAAVVACSNAALPLQIEASDRRWLVPRLSEVAWPREKFVELRAWLENGGLSYILNWALQFPDYIAAGQTSPDSEAKREIVDDSRSPSLRAVIPLVENLAAYSAAATLSANDVDQWARKRTGRDVSMHAGEMRRVFTEKGGFRFGRRIMVQGERQWVMCNRAALDALTALDAAEGPGSHRVSDAAAAMLVGLDVLMAEPL
jgi:hypothetical protein